MSASSPMEQFVRRNLRFNFVIGMLDGGFFGFALGFGSFIAVIPLFVKQLSDSAILIGLIPAIHNFGWQFPQLMTAGWVGRARRFKPLVLFMTVHERLPFLGLAAAAWFLFKPDPALALVLTFLFLSWQGLGGGLTANAWTNLVSKVIPSDLHGTFFGTQAAAFNGLAAVSAVLAGLILEKVPSPLDFTICFLLAAVMFVISYVIIAATRELESPPKLTKEHPAAFWGHSWQILKRDRNFAIFLVVRSVSQFASMAFSFYLVYAVIDYGMSEALAGLMTGVLLISQVAFSPVMGRLGDRWSHRGVMVLGALAAAASALFAWAATSVAWFYPIFLLEAVAIIAIWTIPIALTVSFGKEDERPLYVGLSSTVTAPATIIAPVIGGWLADAAGYDAMFLVSGFCGLLMAAVLIFFVKEPAKKEYEARIVESLTSR